MPEYVGSGLMGFVCGEKCFTGLTVRGDIINNNMDGDGPTFSKFHTPDHRIKALMLGTIWVS